MLFKNVYEIEKFTLLDYPSKIASILFYNGCNFHCPYCYNYGAVKSIDKKDKSDFVKNFLNKRIGKIDAIVFSGGECTIYDKLLLEDIKYVKNLGFLTKLDTNGTNPSLIKTLISEKLVNYIALDFKSLYEDFDKFSSFSLFFSWSDTLETLIKSDVKFEVRTTVHTKLLNEKNINDMIKYLDKRGYKGTYYLQFYFKAPKTLGDIGDMQYPIDISKIVETKNVKIEYRNIEGNV